EHELTTFEFFARLAEEDRHLERENMLAIEVLMQAVVIVPAVLQQYWGRAVLSGGLAAFDKLGMGRREAHPHPHRLVPAVGDGCEVGIKRSAQGLDQGRERIGEIFVFAAPETMPGHDNLAAESFILFI